MTHRLIDDVRNALLGVTKHDGGCEARYRFSPDLPLFEGHFPGDPVLPGVLQIEMVRTALSSLLQARLHIRQVRSAKFKRRIAPGEEAIVRLLCTESSGNLDVKAEITVDGQDAALISLVTQEEMRRS